MKGCKPDPRAAAIAGEIAALSKPEQAVAVGIMREKAKTLAETQQLAEVQRHLAAINKPPVHGALNMPTGPRRH